MLEVADEAAGPDPLGEVPRGPALVVTLGLGLGPGPGPGPGGQRIDISAVDIETVMSRLPGVVEVAAYGVPSQAAGANALPAILNFHGAGSNAWQQERYSAMNAAAARQLRSGMVGHNVFRTEFSIAFGGFKESGIGREGGVEGLYPYTEAKTIILNDKPSHVRAAEVPNMSPCRRDA